MIRRSVQKDVVLQMTASWKIALFAGLADKFGARFLQPDWPESELTAGQLKAKIIEHYPDCADAVSPAFVACNQAFATDEAVVRKGDELALLPPVSGGAGTDCGGGPPAAQAPRYAILDHNLDVEAVCSRVAHPDHGALIAFVGTTREWTQGKRTVLLEYEAYAPMAVATLKQIGEEIDARWPGTLTAIAHRIGSVSIGEASVVIAVSSAHRAEAYEASRYAIERLKQIVPIWKKEVYEDGTKWIGHQLGPWNPLAPIR